MQVENAVALMVESTDFNLNKIVEIHNYSTFKFTFRIPPLHVHPSMHGVDCRLSGVGSSLK